MFFFSGYLLFFLPYQFQKNCFNRFKLDFQWIHKSTKNFNWKILFFCNLKITNMKFNLMNALFMIHEKVTYEFQWEFEWKLFNVKNFNNCVFFFSITNKTNNNKYLSLRDLSHCPTKNKISLFCFVLCVPAL